MNIGPPPIGNTPPPDMLEDHFSFISNATDSAACLFLIVLIFVLFFQKDRVVKPRHFLTGTLLLLTAISGMVLIGSIGSKGPAGQGASLYGWMGPTITVICFLFTYLSIDQCFLSMLGWSGLALRKKKLWILANAAAVAAGLILPIVTGEEGFAYAILLGKLIVDGIIHGTRPGFMPHKRSYIVSVSIASLSIVLAFIWPSIRPMGLGLSIMFVILYLDYHMHVENALESKEIELADTNVKLRAGQISPHFIFNSLQVIEGLCDTEPDKVKGAIQNFSGYLRGNLESLTHDGLIPFAAELEHTREYIALEQLCGRRIFRVEYRLGIEDFMVPPLVLQPLVENAIRYGTSAGEPEDIVVIETSDTEEAILIKVIDSGNGQNDMIPQQKKRKSVGLENVRIRLYAQCSGSLAIDRSDGGTTATITIPHMEESTANNDTEL